MAANFTPSFMGYSGIRPFRWWCQKVLPLVYDDSLSYYELLCKVVHYINNMMADLSVAEENLDALRDAFIQLQEYVNTYLTDEKLQELVNNKLDAMAEAGDLDVLLNSLTHITVKDADDVVMFDTPDEFGRTFAQGLKLVSFDGGGVDGEGGQDIGLVLSRLYNRDKTIQEYTKVDAETGLSLRLMEHQGIVSLTLRSVDEGLVNELKTGNAYVTYALADVLKPRYSVNAYVMVGARYVAQVNILQDGRLQIGFTKTVSDGQPANIPVGTIFRLSMTYIAGYGMTIEQHTIS